VIVTDFTQFDGTLNTEYAYLESDALGSDYWRVLKEFKFYMGSPKSNMYVTVPAGYLTDGASVPRLFWNIVPPWGRYGAATTVHDVLCEYLTIVVDEKPTPISRADADNILREAMLVLGVPPYKAWMIYTAVAAYRKVFRVNHPVSSPKKRNLEAAWAASQGVPVVAPVTGERIA
jgi:hypothetical protein